MQLIALPIRRPLILPDESGFLLNAIRLSEGGPPSGLDYFPGYSVFLAPLTALTSDLSTLTRLVQVVNGLLGIVTALLAVRLARRLDARLSEPVLAVIGMIVAAYPAYRLFAALALSENLLVPWTVALCLVFEWSVRRSGTAEALAFGLLVGLSLSIHTRAVALTVAGGVASLFLHRGRPLLASLAGMVLGGTVALALVMYTLETPVDSGAPRSSASALVSDALSLRGVGDVILSAGGQGFYLLAATGGIVGLGLWALLLPSLRLAQRAETDGEDRAETAIGLLAVLILAASLGVSSLFLAGREGDFAIYGRYGEGVMVPLLVAGLVTLAADATLATQRLGRLIFALPTIGALLVLARGPEAFQGRSLLLNIAGVFPVVDWVGTIRLSTITLFGVVAIIVVGAALRWNFLAGGVFLTAVFLATAGFAIDRSAAAIEVLDGQDDLIAVIADNPADCIALDIWQLADRWHQENYRLSLDDQRFSYWSSAAEDPPCSDLVISQRADLDDVVPGSSVIAVEPFGHQALWVLPGPRQDAIDASEHPSIRDPLAPFPEDQSATVRISTDVPFLTIGTSFETTADVENLGPFGFFPQGGFATVAGSVNLGLEFRLAEQPDVRRHEPFRVRMPTAVGPGDRVKLTQVLRPEDIDPSIEPGSYLLVGSLVQEGIGWTEFSDAMLIEVLR